MACEEQKKTFCSSHAMVIYYSGEAQKNEIYLFYIILKLAKIMRRPTKWMSYIRSRCQLMSSVCVYFNNTHLTTNENAERTRIII